jgi:hypothetical protein
MHSANVPLKACGSDVACDGWAIHDAKGSAPHDTNSNNELAVGKNVTGHTYHKGHPTSEAEARVTVPGALAAEGSKCVAAEREIPQWINVGVRTAVFASRFVLADAARSHICWLEASFRLIQPGNPNGKPSQTAVGRLVQYSCGRGVWGRTHAGRWIRLQLDGVRTCVFARSFFPPLPLPPSLSRSLTRLPMDVGWIRLQLNAPP